MHRVEDEDSQAHRNEDEESEGENGRGRERHDKENEGARAKQSQANEAARAEQSQENERKRQQRSAAPLTASKEGKEGKRPRRSANIEGIMERYLEMKTKQANDEAAQLARERDSAQESDFSIKRCISALSTMEVTKEEKVKAYTVFKSKENRETFLCACEEDPKTAMLWLRSEIA